MMVFPERPIDEDPAAESRAPGPWWKACVGWPDGKKRATLAMPCGHYGTLGLGHTVDASGAVSPSVVCPHKQPDGKPCTFHETIRLDGWRP